MAAQLVIALLIMSDDMEPRGHTWDRMSQTINEQSQRSRKKDVTGVYSTYPHRD